jgi:ABC-type glycerol-3-phosphate transport system permease component
MIIPLFIQMGKFKLIGNQFSALIIYIGLTLPFSIFLLTNFFKTVPVELKEAASIDGCSDLQYFIKVILPLSKPAIATLAIVNGIWIWNELLVALVFLPNDKSRTLMSAIMLNMGKTELNIPLITSGLVVASIPILILFLGFQKWFVRGLVEGSIKG